LRRPAAAHRKIECAVDGARLACLAAGRGGYVDFLPHVYPSLTKTEVSWRISDHYPLWVEFGV